MEDGHLLSIPQERHIQMLAYEINHCARIQRVFNPPNGDNAALRNRLKAVLRSSWQVYEQERARPALAHLADLPEPCLKDEDIRKSLDDFHEWAKDSYGNSGLPLAYLLRDEVDLPEDVDGEEDPGYGEPSRKEEMIRRGPHVGAVAEADNNTVWRAIRQVFGDGPAKNWIKSFTRDQDGRSAHFAIHEHYLGTGFQSRIKTQADHTLTTIFYKGNNKNFKWEKFTGKLQAAFQDLADNDEECSEEKKVRILLARIQCPALAAAACDTNE